MKSNKQKFPTKFDQGNNVRAIARERIGTVPSSKVFNSGKKSMISDDLDLLAEEEISDYLDGADDSDA